ncbi:spore coat protein [Paenibacillus swuensis]|uniref:spore coat protein n=1 Tax=Paenibacillus swuensis TaxID=1178515 RepID=UPI000838B3AE|nr:spore coat protein [Paenibacillus swuensis]
MPFGAHETMEVHEILNEKINMMNHFGLYAQQAQDETLRQMIERHLHTSMEAYDQLVGYTHDYTEPKTSNKMHNIMSAKPQEITYGLRNPEPVGPSDGAEFNDSQIAAAMLSCHKNSAKNHIAKGLECADPNLRQMMINGAVKCADEAYEVFLYMNAQGEYQVPTIKDHTAKTYLHAFQPSGQTLEGGQNESTTYGQTQSHTQPPSGKRYNASDMVRHPSGRPLTSSERREISRQAFLNAQEPMGYVEAVDHAMMNSQVMNSQNQIQEQQLRKQ